MKQSIIIITFGLLLGLAPQFVHAIDTDADGLEDHIEQHVYFTDPHNPDTDGDGYVDGIEVQHDYSPHKGDGAQFHQSDVDGDGLNDWVERWFHSSIGIADTDNNGETDFDQVMRGMDPTGNKTGALFDRRIVVDRSTQRLSFQVDRIKIVDFPVSTGNPDSETPGGEFTIERMIDEKSYIGPGYNLPGVKWNMQFKPMYYIHTAYWHNDFGRRTHSHGCVNMTEADASLLYKYMDVGVPVSIVGETPAGYVVGS